MPRISSRGVTSRFVDALLNPFFPARGVLCEEAVTRWTSGAI
jgi:hypothetical protein